MILFLFFASDLQTVQALMFAIAVECKRPPLATDVTLDVQNLIQECWSQSAASRPSFDVVCSRLMAVEGELPIHVTARVGGGPGVNCTKNSSKKPPNPYFQSPK